VADIATAGGRVLAWRALPLLLARLARRGATHGASRRARPRLPRIHPGDRRLGARPRPGRVGALGRSGPPRPSAVGAAAPPLCAPAAGRLRGPRAPRAFDRNRGNSTRPRARADVRRRARASAAVRDSRPASCACLACNRLRGRPSSRARARAPAADSLRATRAVAPSGVGNTRCPPGPRARTRATRPSTRRLRLSATGCVGGIRRDAKGGSESCRFATRRRGGSRYWS